METFLSFFTPEWLSAFGTIGAVFVALFYHPIRNYINRPKIKMEYSEASPCIEKIEEASNSSNKDKRMVIRVCITNSGKFTADYSVLNVDEYWKKRSKDNTFVRRQFTPKAFKDCNGAKLTTIAPHLKYFVDIAAIQKYKGMTSADQPAESKQFYKLFLLGDGKNMELGRGTFVIPLKFYSSRSNVKISYMRIYWESDEFNTEKSSFDVKLISEKQFKKLEKVI